MKNTYFTSRQIAIKADTLLLTRSGESIKSNVAIEKIISGASIGIEGVSEIRCSSHTLRHYFAKTSIKNGQDIFTLSKLLGHSSIKITQRYLESMKYFNHPLGYEWQWRKNKYLSDFFLAQAEGLVFYYTAHQNVPTFAEITEIRKRVSNLIDYSKSETKGWNIFIHNMRY